MVLCYRLVAMLATVAMVLALPACTATPLIVPVAGLTRGPQTAEPAPSLQADHPSRPELLRSVVWLDGNDRTPVKDLEGPPHAAEVPEASDWLTAPPDAWSRLHLDLDLGWEDYQRFYSWQNLGLVALGVGLAAPLANTSADRSIRDGYQQHVRTSGVDSLAKVVTNLSQFWVVVPAGLEAAALAGKASEDYTTDGGLFEWSNRSLRAAAVGYPTVLLLFVTLGGDRPDKGDSHWQPFEGVHGVSGHTFVGAIPFLTAAAMTENPYWKAPLVLGSFLTGWSRLHLDLHYFSQVALGWWLAYLSVQSVEDTQEMRQRALTLSPALGPDGARILLQLQY
jgi:hypothetical protein